MRPEPPICQPTCGPTDCFAFARDDDVARHFDPTGKSILIYRNYVKPQNQKYFCFSELKIRLWFACLTRQEGRIMIVTNVRWDAVDADVATDERD
jgi:hypothetical protein